LIFPLSVQLHRHYQVLTCMLTSSIRFLAFIHIDTSRLRPILEPLKARMAIAGETEHRFLLFDVSTRPVRRTPSWVLFALLNDVFNDVILSTSICRFIVDAVVASALAGVWSFSVNTPVENMLIQFWKARANEHTINY
jgi:hypothetical protein